MGLAQSMARFVSELGPEDIPDDVTEKARCCVLNGYGIALGAHPTAFHRVAAEAALAMDGPQPQGATLLGDGRRTTVSGAALANGALFHGRAQEDTCGTSHFGANLLPLLTALVETGAPVARLLPALIAGYEVGGLLERHHSATTTARGLRASQLYGGIAAAAAVAKLWNLPTDRTEAAIATAASFAGGLLQSFADGTDEWRYQVGIAARQGLVAASLAAKGAVAAPRALEGAAGFVPAFAGKGCDVDGMAAELGRIWSVPRVTFKPHPVCALNQTPVTAAAELHDRLGGRLAHVRQVRVRMNPTCTGYAGMDATGPFSTLSGTLMSIQFCVATTLVHGVPTIARMTTFDDPQVNSLIPRILPESDDTFGLLGCRIEVDLAGAEEPLVCERRVDHAEYSYDRAQVSALVRRIGAETGVGPAAFDRLERFAEALPMADLADVLAAFAEIQPVRD